LRSEFGTKLDEIKQLANPKAECYAAKDVIGTQEVGEANRGECAAWRNEPGLKLPSPLVPLWGLLLLRLSELQGGADHDLPESC
jgi:hypothetical protein